MLLLIFDVDVAMEWHGWFAVERSGREGCSEGKAPERRFPKEDRLHRPGKNLKFEGGSAAQLSLSSLCILVE